MTDPYAQSPGWCGMTEVDDRWLVEWFEYGFAELNLFLANQARYEEWCRRVGREP